MKNNLLTLSLAACILFFYAGCAKDGSSEAVNSASGTSISGSLSLFAFHGNYLYKIERETKDMLYIYNVAKANKPTFVAKFEMPNGIETIIAENYLFFGTESGMLIYSLTNPEQPVKIATYQHVVACDPVAIQGNYAFVTLSSGQARCFRNVNELQVIDISTITNPKKIASYSFNKPQGLAVAGQYLYLCEGEFGLKVLDISSVMAITTAASISGINVVDAIANEGVLTLRGPDGIYRYSYENPLSLRRLSFTPAQ